MSKAAVIYAYGPPEALVYADIQDDVLGSTEIRVQLRAIGVNAADWKTRAGMFAEIMPFEFPRIIGYDGAGIVTEIGADVKRFQPGAKVLLKASPFAKRGSYAEFATVPETFAAAMPEGLSFEAAAALPTPALTGMQLIEDRPEIGPGSRVLVTGLTGSVGRALLYAAKSRGATVIAAVRQNNAKLALELGADAVIVQEDAGAGLAPPAQFLVDTVGGEFARWATGLLDGDAAVITVATDPFTPRSGKAPVWFAVRENGDDLARAAAAVSAGKLTMPAIVTMGLKDAAAAHRGLEAGEIKGRVVLLP